MPLGRMELRRPLRPTFTPEQMRNEMEERTNAQKRGEIRESTILADAAEVRPIELWMPDSAFEQLDQAHNDLSETYSALKELSQVTIAKAAAKSHRKGRKTTKRGPRTRADRKRRENLAGGPERGVLPKSRKVPWAEEPRPFRQNLSA